VLSANPQPAASNSRSRAVTTLKGFAPEDLRGNAADAAAIKKRGAFSRLWQNRDDRPHRSARREKQPRYARRFDPGYGA
jgi:hypothetical protein